MFLTFPLSSSGIIKNNAANPPTHGVSLIGYTTINGTDVWIIANSWGEEWGMNGFAYIERGYNNLGVGDINVHPMFSSE